jgi:hypothetical protein
MMPDSNCNMAGHCGGLVGRSGFNCIFFAVESTEITAFRALGPVPGHYENSWCTLQPTFYEFGYEFMVTAWAAAKIKNIIIKLRVPARPRFVGMHKANSDHANLRRYTIYTSGDHYCSMLNRVFAIFTAKLGAKESVNMICRIPKSGSSNPWFWRSKYVGEHNTQ